MPSRRRRALYRPQPEPGTARSADRADRDARAGSHRRVVEIQFPRRRPSIAEGQAVLTRFGTADQHAALMVDPDRLTTPERDLLHLHLVPPLPTIADHPLTITPL